MKHTPGPWHLTINGDIESSHMISLNGYAEKVGTVCILNSDDIIYNRKKEMKANAALISTSPELLEELEIAHKIIINALNSMTTAQKKKWCELNGRDDLIDDLGITREQKRREVIAKATRTGEP